MKAGERGTVRLWQADLLSYGGMSVQKRVLFCDSYFLLSFIFSEDRQLHAAAALLIMSRYHNTTMCHYWDMSVK